MDFVCGVDLSLLERACRSPAVQYSADAERQRNPMISNAAAESAKQFERLAELMRRFREVSAG